MINTIFLINRLACLIFIIDTGLADICRTIMRVGLFLDGPKLGRSWPVALYVVYLFVMNSVFNNGISRK
jgi:hypothetical protein